jgi:excisionase family DNA binding protein
MEQKNITQLHEITPEELKEKILQDFRVELKQLTQNIHPKIQEEYLTKKEVSQILKVSLVTIHDWNKKKILNPFRLGNLIRYKRSDLEKAFIRINNNDTGWY